MPDLDLEKVIEILEKAKTIIEGWVPMFEQYNTPAGIDDAIALLKAQEPVKPKKVKGYKPPVCTLFDYECENCESPIMEKQPFCAGCGKALKWKP